MGKCYEGITIPEQITEPCGNVYMSTNCVVTPIPLIYLDIAIGDSQTDINKKLILALQASAQLIQELTERVELLETN